MIANSRVTKDGGCIHIVGVNPEDQKTESVASSDVTNKRGGAFTDLDLEILEALAEHATLVAGTLNLDRQNSTITRVIDGVALTLPPPSPSGPPVQLERFSPARNRV